MKKVNANDFRLYSKLDVIPLHQYNAQAEDGTPLGKSPVEAEWAAKPRVDSAKIISRCIADNRNMGFRPGAGDLIVDVDPRNGGDESFERLVFNVGLDPAKHPKTVTGSGGFHLYGRKPTGLRTRKKLKQYPGIEFISRGGQVLAAGCVHPNGNYYTHAGPAYETAPQWPADLFDEIKRTDEVPTAGTTGGGQMSPDQLRAALEKLDPTEFRDHDAWLQVMMAAHAATDGEGLDVFEEWSTSDDQYSDAGESIRLRWRSLSPSGGVTVRTLNHILRDHGALDEQAAPTAHEVMADFESTPLDTGTTTPTADKKPTRKGKLKGQTFDDLMALADPKWLVEGIVAENALFEIFGQFKAGKTFFGMEMALCIATGIPFLDDATKTVADGAPVLYIIAEGNRKMFGYRIQRWIKERARKRGVRESFLTELVNKNFAVVARSVKVNETDQLREFILDNAGRAWKAVFVDTLMRNMSGDPMKPADMIAFMEGCDKLRLLPSRPAVIFLHHMRRENATGGYGPIIGEAYVDGAATVTKSRQKRIFKLHIMRDADDDADPWTCEIHSFDTEFGSNRTVGGLVFKGRGATNPKEKVFVFVARALGSGDPCPKQADIAAALGISVTTVERSFAELRDDDKWIKGQKEAVTLTKTGLAEFELMKGETA